MATSKKRSRRTKGEGPALARRSCGTMASHMLLVERHPAVRERLFRLEETTARRRTLGMAVTEFPIATIKVVAHVAYATAAHNTSDAQIKSQIKVLNQDFRAPNSDRRKVPAS